MKILLIFRFFYYIWFIGSENLCFILILKEKKKKKLQVVLKFDIRRGSLLNEILYVFFAKSSLIDV